MLEDILKSYKRKAEVINWKNYTINDLFFEYIKHENDDLADNFFAGIVCRVWGYSGRIFTKCNKHIPFEECYDCVLDAVRYVIKKRVWENPDNSLYGDKTGPDKAFHIALKRQMSIMLSKYNAKRRLSNFNTMSIDEAHESFNDSADGLLFDINDNTYLDTFISEFFDNKEYLKGLFLVGICYNTDTYSTKNVIKWLRNLNKTEIDHFIEIFKLNSNEFYKVLTEVRDMSNKYIELKLNSFLYSLKKEGLF